MNKGLGIAFFEGATLQYESNGSWIDWNSTNCPSLTNGVWRIKPDTYTKANNSLRWDVLMEICSEPSGYVRLLQGLYTKDELEQYIDSKVIKLRTLL